MIRTRYLVLLLALVALAACDQPSDSKAKSAQPEQAMPAQTAAPEPAAEKPQAEPAPALVATPVAPVPVAPEPAPKVAALPAPPSPSAPAKAKAPSNPRPAVKPKPKAALDLSLPTEVFEELPALEPLAEMPAVLPQMFGEKPAQESPFQLNGKLINNQRTDDYWDSVEGAELQFEFKH